MSKSKKNNKKSSQKAKHVNAIKKLLAKLKALLPKKQKNKK